MTRILFIADAHAGINHLDGAYKILGNQAPALMTAVLEFAERSGAAAVGDIGDRMNCASGTTPEMDLMRLGTFHGLTFHQSSLPVLHADGNHDLANASSEALSTVLGRTDRTGFIDLPGDVRFITFNPERLSDEKTGQTVFRFNIAELAQCLTGSEDKRVVLMSHFGFIRDIAPHCGKQKPGSAYRVECDNAAVRALLESHPRARDIQVISGHEHRLIRHNTPGGPTHTVIPSLTQAYNGLGAPGQASGVFGILDIGYEGVLLSLMTMQIERHPGRMRCTAHKISDLPEVRALLPRTHPGYR